MRNVQWLIGANGANGANWGLRVLVAKDLMVNILLCCRKISIFAAQRERARAHVGPMHV